MKYLKPVMTVVQLETEDIITTSSASDGCGSGVSFDGWCISGSTEIDSGNVCDDDFFCSSWADWGMND